VSIYGLIGFPLDHSRSPEWFAGKFAAEGRLNDRYLLFPLESAEGFRPMLWREKDLSGLNVTIPHKVAILPYLDELDETAAAVGAVNTIRIRRAEGGIHTKGFNTDAPAFLATLERFDLAGPALILGTGGASRAVAWALKRTGIPYRFVSRKKDEAGVLTYADLDAETIAGFRIIINTTPLGMGAWADQCPSLPYSALTPRHLLYDLIYHPEETLFLRQGRAQGALTLNGRPMLEAQAELAYRIFTAGE